MKKRILSLLLALSLLFCSLTFLSSCSGDKGKNAGVKIGVLRSDASSEEALAWEKYLRDLCSEMGVSIDFTAALKNADEELSALQNYASLGYNGILALTDYDPTNVLNKCQDAGMYLVFAALHPDFEPSDHALNQDPGKIISDYTNYPYYVGAAGRSDYGEVLDGYRMGEAAVEAGYTKYSVFTGSAAYGQSRHALRIAGFLAALYDKDPSVTYQDVECKLENWKTITEQIKRDSGLRLTSFCSEQFSILAEAGGYAFCEGDAAAVEAVRNLSAVPGVECVFCVDSADGISSLAPNGTPCVYVGNDSLGQRSENLFREGKLIFNMAKYNSYVGPALAVLLKSVCRDSAVRVNGRPVLIEQEGLQITGADEYTTVNSAEDKNGGYFFSAELLSAYLLEADLGANDSGYTKITDGRLVEVASLEGTLSGDGLYDVCKKISKAFADGGYSVFRFASGN